MASDDTRITLTRTAAGSPRGSEVVVPRELSTVHLVREIGRGGMGVVYVGWDTMLGRDVAVKFLLNAVTGPDDPGFTRFLEGARAAADVRHGGLNTIFQADVVAGIPYLVLDYIDGPTVGAVIRSEGALSVSACAAILETVASAVGALHERGILHRDIKPENVLLSFEGQAVVTDFGLAHARGASHENRVGGTPAYMAPEMFDGVVSERSDVYALGITMFEMLTGDLPFRGALDEVRSMHAADPLPVALLDDRDVSTPFRDILERATHKNPMYRYKTGEHLLRAVRDAIGREHVATASDLSTLAARCLGKSAVGDCTPSPAPGSASYSEQIATLAESKRSTRQPASEDATVAQEADDTLHLTHCPQCNYNLDQLPRDYRCPECGFAYDASMFVVYGWASQHHLPNFRRMILGSRSVLLQFPIGLFFCYVVFRNVRSGNWRFLSMFGFVALCVYAQYALRRSKQRAFGGALQLAFSSEGASIRLGPGEPRFIPWKKFRRLKFRRVEKNRWRLLLSAQRINLFLPSRGGRRSPFGKPIVTAVIECDDAKADCLRREIQRRLDAAKSASLTTKSALTP